MDLTLSVLHTTKTLLVRGRTPKYYVPKVEHYLEARWWNRLLSRLEELSGLPLGTLRATFLIETLPAAFQMEEILYELREQTARVIADKEFEFALGHDGCWVSHPYFIAPAMASFPASNQLGTVPEIDDEPDMLPIGTAPKSSGAPCGKSRSSTPSAP